MKPAVLQEGRLNALAATTAAELTHAEGGAVYLRTLAQLLERHLQQNPDSYVHWVSVVNEPSTFGPPSVLWEYSDSLLQVSLAEGHSEGMVIYVFAQADRYDLTKLVPLFRIKVLCSGERAVRELHWVWNFLNSSEFEEATKRCAG